MTPHTRILLSSPPPKAWLVIAEVSTCFPLLTTILNSCSATWHTQVLGEIRSGLEVQFLRCLRQQLASSSMHASFGTLNQHDPRRRQARTCSRRTSQLVFLCIQLSASLLCLVVLPGEFASHSEVRLVALRTCCLSAKPFKVSRVSPLVVAAACPRPRHRPVSSETQVVIPACIHNPLAQRKSGESGVLRPPHFLHCLRIMHFFTLVPGLFRTFPGVYCRSRGSAPNGF